MSKDGTTTREKFNEIFEERAKRVAAVEKRIGKSIIPENSEKRRKKVKVVSPAKVSEKDAIKAMENKQPKEPSLTEKEFIND